jgi:hypothetical protein
MNWIARIIIGLLGLGFLAIMGLLGLGFLAALLLGLLCYVVYATLRWLLTGRKPRAVMAWQRVSAMRQSFRKGGFRMEPGQGFEDPRGRSTPFADKDRVVDVEVREVEKDAQRSPSDRRP